MYLTKQYLTNSIEKLDKIREEGSIADWFNELKEVLMSDITSNPKKYMSEPLYQWFVEEKIFLKQFEGMFAAGQLTKSDKPLICTNGMVILENFQPSEEEFFCPCCEEVDENV